MNVYTSNIVMGFLTFPLIAFAITIPYMIYQYRKFGSIPWIRTLIVYSFVLYALCAYFMIILPLPEDRHAVVPYAVTPQLIPFNFLQGFLAETSFSINDPSTWLPILRDSYIYQAFFNVLLLVPLGMYLRYYFRRTWWQTLLIGFATTLFFETSQISGLWGLYEHPYRLFDVDDLLMNTLGTMVGFWMMGPLMHALPDIRLVNEEAREAGVRASATKRGLSFGIDLAVATVLLIIIDALYRSSVPDQAIAFADGLWGRMVLIFGVLVLLVAFVLIPTLTHGQTLGQKVLRLRIVRADATPAHWYHFLARYGLLFFAGAIPVIILGGILSLPPAVTSEIGGIRTFFVRHLEAVFLIWLGLMTLWVLSLIARALIASIKKRPFVMLNGLLSNTRVMTCAGVEIEREHRQALSVEEVHTLEELIAKEGTSQATLMKRAGQAAANEVCAWVPDPAPVVVLLGTGNNAGDGWVCAHILAEKGYPTTLITPDLAERITAEPARSIALDIFADASARNLPLRILIAPDEHIVTETIDKAEAVVDALLGTGFSGEAVREPAASWIRSANRRRFEGLQTKGRGKHRKRAHEQGDHVHRAPIVLPAKAHRAPFALAIDIPSGLCAQTGKAANPTFAADVTLTMLAFKPGLTQKAAGPWTGVIKLAKLVDRTPYLEQLGSKAVPTDRKTPL